MAKKRRTKNPVAKNMEAFNRPSTHRDKTKYNRKNKKGSVDPFSLSGVSNLLFFAFLPRTTSL